MLVLSSVALDFLLGPVVIIGNWSSEQRPLVRYLGVLKGAVLCEILSNQPIMKFR